MSIPLLESSVAENLHMNDKELFVRVFLGTLYETTQTIDVNGSTSHVSSEALDAEVAVRIQNYRGPRGAKRTCSYFTGPHSSDLYSIQLQVTFKKDVNGDDLLWGNDFDKPIRDNLPYGYSMAYRIMKTMIDPGIDGDVNADRPYLYGPALSSMNQIAKLDSATWASKIDQDLKGMTPVERMSHYLDQSKRKNFTFLAGETYAFDFFNGYLDFNEFSLKLPGFRVKILQYWDGQPLRYVLKTKDEVLLVVKFELGETKLDAADGNYDDDVD